MVANTKWHARSKAVTTGQGKFYHIQIRSKYQFVLFRNHDVGKSWGLERLAGQRANGNRDTISRLVSKDCAHIKDWKLIIDEQWAKSVLGQIEWDIAWLKGDVFKAKPVKNVAKKDKPTAAQKKAQSVNIKNLRQQE